MRKWLGVALIATTATVILDAQSVRRTIYVTARAADGTPLLDLPAADLVVSEAGQPRPIIRVQPSRTTLKIAVAVEERLAPDDEVRRAVANFIDRVRTTGQVALYVVGRRSERRVDYSSEIVPFARAINGFPSRGVDPGNVVEAVREIARDQRSREGRRVIVVVGIEGHQASTVTADAVLEQLRAGSNVLYAATLANWTTSSAPAGATSGGRRLDLEGQVSGLEGDRLFGDGTRQSGGLHVSSQRTAGMFAVLERMADELNHQFVVSYEGDPRSDGTVSVTAGHPRITVRGPTRTR
jgi:hypothetical protein